MREQDILNAIDEVDLKYVTQAWENTQPPTEEKQRLGDKRRGGFAAIGTGIAAALLVGFVAITYMRGNPRLPINSETSNAGISPAVSIPVTSESSAVTSGNSGETSEVSKSSVPSVSSVTSVPVVVDSDIRSGELYGPDKETFTYSENDDGMGIITRDGDKTIITYNDFVYLGAPKNIFSNLTNPGFFIPYEYGFINEAVLKLYKQEVPYKRFYVGDKYHDLTLSSAKTVFVQGDPQEKRGKELKSMVAEFEGTTKFPAFIYCIKNTYYAVPMPENVPGRGANKIPAMSLLKTNWNSEYETESARINLADHGIARVYTDVVIRLNNPEEFGLADLISDDKGFGMVSIELSDIHIEYDPTSSKSGVDLTTASIESIEATPTDWNGTYENTTDAYTTIDNYFRRYVFDTYGLSDRTESYTLLNVTETTEDVEKIREELMGRNPGETPKNPDCAELIHDYEVIYYDGKNMVTATCRLIHDEGFSDLWAVLLSQTINTVEGNYIQPR